MTTEWTQDGAIAFEAARECISHMLAICSSEIADEESKAQPDSTRLQLLLKREADLARERDELHADQPERIDQVRREYGEQIRAHRAARAASKARNP